MPFCKRPVLACVPGRPVVWAEASALEGLLYAKHDLEVALGSHEIFFNLQREDGLMPCVIHDLKPPRIQFSQLQQNVPFARTAWELAQLTKNEEFLARAYQACSRFDRWIAKNRNTRGTGLVEMFHIHDMGLDYSPRCHDYPLVAPDLSALSYGARVALAKMANALGKPEEARQWLDRAEEIRGLILKHCFDAEDEFFYDVKPDGTFNRILETQLQLVCQEHVVGRELFERIYKRYIQNPKHYWAPYPFPSISLSDPHFAPKAGAWTGASFAQVIYRAMLWMPHYGKQNDLRVAMSRWVEAHCMSKRFETIIHPLTGKGFAGDAWGDASAALLLFIESVDYLDLLK